MDGIEERLDRIERILVVTGKSVFTLSEAALFLGLSETRVYHLTSAREIPFYKKGRSVFFKRSELEEWMTDKDDRVMTEAETEEAASRIRNILRHNNVQ